MEVWQTINTGVTTNGKKWISSNSKRNIFIVFVSNMKTQVWSLRPTEYLKHKYEIKCGIVQTEHTKIFAQVNEQMCSKYVSHPSFNVFKLQIQFFQFKKQLLYLKQTRAIPNNGHQFRDIIKLSCLLLLKNFRETIIPRVWCGWPSTKDIQTTWYSNWRNMEWHKSTSWL